MCYSLDDISSHFTVIPMVILFHECIRDFSLMRIDPHQRKQLSFSVCSLGKNIFPTLKEANVQHEVKSGCWFQICCIFTPKIGEIIQFDLRIFFQMGW